MNVILPPLNSTLPVKFRDEKNGKSRENKTYAKIYQKERGQKNTAFNYELQKGCLILSVLKGW